MSETFDVSYEITAEALTDATRLHQSSLLARYRVVVAAVAVVGALIAVAIDYSLGFTIAGTASVLLLMTWMTFFDRWLNASRGRGVIGSTTRYVVDEEGIRYEHPLGSGRLAWSALTQVRANDKTVVLARDRVLAAYVPVSAFGSTSEKDRFVSFASNRVASNVRPASPPAGDIARR